MNCHRYIRFVRRKEHGIVTGIFDSIEVKNYHPYHYGIAISILAIKTNCDNRMSSSLVFYMYCYMPNYHCVPRKQTSYFYMSNREKGGGRMYYKLGLFFIDIWSPSLSNKVETTFNKVLARNDISELLLMLALNTNRSINKSINESPGYGFNYSHFTSYLLL